MSFSVLLCYCIKTAISLDWTVSTTVLPYQLEGAVAAVYNNYVSILGGYYLDIIDGKNWQLKNEKIYKYPMDAILSSDNSIEWTTITPSVGIGGQQSQFVIFDNMIYSYTNQLYIYNLKQDTFMSTSLYQHGSPFNAGSGSCIVGINKQYIVITGGYSGRDAISNTQIYDTNKDEWLMLDAYSMYIARGYHTCIYSNIDSNIYVVSGLTGDFIDDVYTKTIEIFHIDTSSEWNQWDGWKLSDLSLDVGLRCMMAVEYHDYIYLFGGLYASWSDLANKYNNKVINVVIRFNVITQTMIYDSVLPRYTFWAPIIVYDDKIIIIGGWGMPNDGKFETSIQIAQFSETFLNIHNITNFTQYAIMQNTPIPTTTTVAISTSLTSISQIISTSSDNEPINPMTTTSIINKNTTYYTTASTKSVYSIGDKNNNKSGNMIVLWVLAVLGVTSACFLLFLYVNYNKKKNRRNEVKYECRSKKSKKTQMITNTNDNDIEMEGLNNNQDQCVICMDSLSLNGKIGKLECNHTFHRKCLIEWVESNPTCPLCRTQCTNMSFI